ncbi:alpha/beta fold hydrolase [Luteimicrobium subarcticum]|uniref:Alpha-beta hydrolase superfamily lysophospholipase n=1 Tax=Luteimicrobium subarcticum TaxID=620910 RepID=A0A2M8W3X4_9MICO|nr:alpha/beta hydrolase [Luteimicrobium subarcticum]PJI85618.1 alpha-beta hydrolase superfamily lysophospholipase [Luteimicrobium subarcticum]
MSGPALVVGAAVSSRLPAWEDDALLDGYRSVTLTAGAASQPPDRRDGAGAPVLTVVRPATTPARPRGVVVHVHGYNDYFFQTHLVDALGAAGWAFLAVDVRRAGRSLRPGDVPHYTDDLAEPARDLATAVALARTLHPGLPVVVHAHSTGGLVAALWAHSVRGSSVPATGPVDALVLDSPFLDLRASWAVRTLGTSVVDLAAPYRPLAVLATGTSWYATHLLAANGGRWDFDPTLKRPDGVPVRMGWLRAVRRGQSRVVRGLEIDVPVLVARSARSGADTPDNPGLDREDTVLDVRSIARLGPRLGPHVDELVVDGGVHDLTLSADEPRRAYLDGMLGWLDAQLPRTGR